MFNFETKPVYRETKEFVKFIYKITQNFPKEEKYGLIDQIRRAAISVLLNIAEGFTKNSKNERRRFLWISQGSIGEVVAAFDIAQELEIINQEIYQEVYKKSENLAKQINGLIYSGN